MNYFREAHNNREIIRIIKTGKNKTNQATLLLHLEHNAYKITTHNSCDNRLRNKNVLLSSSPLTFIKFLSLVNVKNNPNNDKPI